MTVLCSVGESASIALDLLAHLRAANLLGEANLHGAPDELLLHSGGPQSDIARASLLMGPATMRFIVRQPAATPLDTAHSPLRGELRLQTGPAPIRIEVQTWQDGWSTTEVVEGSNLSDGLRRLSAFLPPTDCEGLAPGGLAGLLTYDMVQYTEPLRLRHPPDAGEVLMVLYRADRWVIHQRNSACLECHSIDANDPWVREVESLLLNPVPRRGEVPEPTPITPSTESDEVHADKVRRTQTAIRKGVLYQLNYGRIWSGPIDEPWVIFERLARDNPAPCAAWLAAPDLGLAVASSSPEQLLRQQGRTISTRPIKGTRPRGDDGEHDANLRGELVGSRKEIAEHLMLVDLERNDLGRICTPGSVRWKRWRIESYPHVQHMVSEIEGQLAEGKDGYDALHSIFPGGSITGCPKSATIAAIDELEATPRRVWTGSIGHIDPRTGVAEWNILIRTLEARMCEGTWQATVQAGGGLVIGSDPLQEVEEAKWKAHALCKAAWGHAPAGDAVRVPSGSGAVSFHPIPPVTATVRRLIESRDEGLVQGPLPECPSPLRWHEGLHLEPSEGKRVLFVDNLDSFSWNIVHGFATLGAQVIVVPGRIGPADAQALLSELNPTHVVLGPGPGRPEQSTLTTAFATQALKGRGPPLLGICLGHQAIGQAAGWTLSPTRFGAVHGVPDRIQTGDDIEVMTRYHSLALTPTNDTLEVISTDAATASLVMALAHPTLPIRGVQYHPESAGSVEGLTILADFLAQ